MATAATRSKAQFCHYECVGVVCFVLALWYSLFVYVLMSIPHGIIACSVIVALSGHTEKSM